MVFGEKTQKYIIVFLKKLIEKVLFKIKAIRTDSSVEFGNKVRMFIKKYGIQLIKNSPYTP